jgi:hypothetical protein
MNEWIDGRTDGRTSTEQLNQQTKERMKMKVAQMSFFIKGGTNVDLQQVAQKSFPYHRWDKRSSGRNVVVAETSAALTSVAKTSVAKKSRHLHTHTHTHFRICMGNTSENNCFHIYPFN